jgi:hypothetical protein
MISCPLIRQVRLVSCNRSTAAIYRSNPDVRASFLGGSAAQWRLTIANREAGGYCPPPAELAPADAYSNQTELPTLFYILTLLAYFTHLAGILFVVVAWVFVIFRLLHAYVHVTSNIVNLRGMLFGLGSVVLAVMWVIFIIQVLGQP